MAFAQLTHAAGESSDGNLNPGTYAVVLGVENERLLRRLARNLEAVKEPVHRVVESHGEYSGQLMALGLSPGPKSVRGRFLSNIPLASLGSFLEFTQRMEWQAKSKRGLHRQRVDKIQKEVREKYIPVDKSIWKTLRGAWSKWRKVHA